MFLHRITNPSIARPSKDPVFLHSSAKDLTSETERMMKKIKDFQILFDNFCFYQ